MPSEMSLRYYGIDDAYSALGDEVDAPMVSDTQAAEMARETLGGMRLVVYLVVIDVLVLCGGLWLLTWWWLKHV